MPEMKTLLVPTTSAMLSDKIYREVETDPTRNLLDAIRSNSFSRIKTALAAPGIHYGSRDAANGAQTLLMRVCHLSMARSNRWDLAKLLLETLELDVNARDSDGRTALAHACIMGDTTMVKLLADDADVDPNIADSEGDTPLMHACRVGQIDVVTTLLTNFLRLGLQVDEPNNEGVTPLIEAAKCGHADICRKLVTVGKADVNARDGNSFNTAQDYAIASRRLSTPDILLLSPIAQRKLKAQKKREAMGHSSLTELMERAAFYPTSDWRHKAPMDSFEAEHGAGEGKTKPRKAGKPSQLQREHLQQLNSVVFQVANHGLGRVEEQRQEEDQQDVDKQPRRRKISRSLPDLRDVDFNADATSSGSRSSSPHKTTHQDHHLRVPHRLSPSTSPSPNRKNSPRPPSCPPKTPSCKSPPAKHSRPKLPSVESPNYSPASTGRISSIQNKLHRPTSSKDAPVAKAKGTPPHLNAGLSRTPPNNWAVSASKQTQGAVHVVVANLSVESRTRLTWEGRPSSSIPSYLFR